MRSNSSHEIEFGSDGGVLLPDSQEYIGASLGARRVRLTVGAYHFVPRFGWLYRALPYLTVGAMLQMTGIPLHQRINVESQLIYSTGGADGSSSTSRFFFFDDEVKARAPIPLELEVGVGYKPTSRLLIAADASFHSPVRDRQRIRVPATLTTREVGFFFDPTTKRQAVGNFALATDVLVTENLMFELGAFTDFSAAPRIPSHPDIFQVPRIHRFGTTASVAVHVRGLSLALGATAVFGRGHATSAFVDLQNDVSNYSRSNARSRLIYLHITGASELTSSTASKAESFIDTDSPEEVD
ncbi:MAG: hypothetical protein R3A47_05515 [Polyangiales bacterium]